MYDLFIPQASVSCQNVGAMHVRNTARADLQPVHALASSHQGFYIAIMCEWHSTMLGGGAHLLFAVQPLLSRLLLLHQCLQTALAT